MKCIELFYQDCIAENNIAVSKKSRDDVIRETAFIIMFSCVCFFYAILFLLFITHVDVFREGENLSETLGRAAGCDISFRCKKC